MKCKETKWKCIFAFTWTSKDFISYCRKTSQNVTNLAQNIAWRVRKQNVCGTHYYFCPIIGYILIMTAHVFQRAGLWHINQTANSLSLVYFGKEQTFVAPLANFDNPFFLCTMNTSALNCTGLEKAYCIFFVWSANLIRQKLLI